MWRVLAVAMIALWTAPASAERLRAPDGSIKDVPDASVEYALRDGYKRVPKVVMRGRDGTLYDIDEDMAGRMESERGFWRLTVSELADLEQQRRQEREEAEIAGLKDRIDLQREVDERDRSWTRRPRELLHEYGSLMIILPGALALAFAILRPWRYFDPDGRRRMWGGLAFVVLLGLVALVVEDLSTVALCGILIVGAYAALAAFGRLLR